MEHYHLLPPCFIHRKPRLPAYTCGAPNTLYWDPFSALSAATSRTAADYVEYEQRQPPQHARSGR
eukprot:109695-Rhodomonas_salina.1